MRKEFIEKILKDQKWYIRRKNLAFEMLFMSLKEGL